MEILIRNISKDKAISSKIRKQLKQLNKNNEPENPTYDVILDATNGFHIDNYNVLSVGVIFMRFLDENHNCINEIVLRDGDYSTIQIQ